MGSLVTRAKCLEDVEGASVSCSFRLIHHNVGHSHSVLCARLLIFSHTI